MKKWIILCCVMLNTSCVMFGGSRTTTTQVTSTPSGADVYAIHTESAHKYIYESKRKARHGDKVMSYQGTTPLMVEVLRGKNTKILVYKNGYKETELYIKAKKEVSYFDRKNKACMGDRYYSWMLGGILDEIVNEYIFKNIKNDYCKEVRHNYHINLQNIG